MKAFIIAEAGVNHDGSLSRARELVKAAKSAGADAVKFQTFNTDKLVSKKAPKAEYQIQNTDKNESQYDMIKRLELSEAMHLDLMDLCKKESIEFLSTPFDLESLDLLVDKFRLPLIKLGSGEVSNAPLLLGAGRSQRNLILSTGMSDLAEVEMALGVVAFGLLRRAEEPSISAFRSAFASAEGKAALKKRLRLLHCTTEYPTPFSDVNLRAMDTLREAFGLEVGMSDHSPGITVPIAAVALGATVIEKHFTLDKTLPGPDHKASLEPQELREMVRMIRETEMALGSGRKEPASSELKNKAVVRRSLVAARNIAAGERFTEENLTVKRPGNGISSLHYWDFLGQAAKRAFAKDELIE